MGAGGAGRYICERVSRKTQRTCRPTDGADWNTDELEEARLLGSRCITMRQREVILAQATDEP
jgi:hypothetical protein